MQIMDEASLPQFIKQDGSGSGSGSGSSHRSGQKKENCYSLDHPFHQELYNYIKEQYQEREHVQPIRQGSVHVSVPDLPQEGTEIAKTIKLELQKLENTD
ncbi:hypothetical protein SAY87_022837 [Trapa incisa]|uniref:Uncharacterized protein n=1 Tax=Trapa incisa TaxID=236973 RepID=A0AAN7Q4T6_9MYRT|nr:hypothetical protein SAY87_022837 [Trapa incisa]